MNSRAGNTIVQLQQYNYVELCSRHGPSQYKQQRMQLSRTDLDL